MHVCLPPAEPLHKGEQACRLREAHSPRHIRSCIAPKPPPPNKHRAAAASSFLPYWSAPSPFTALRSFEAYDGGFTAPLPCPPPGGRGCFRRRCCRPRAASGLPLTPRSRRAQPGRLPHAVGAVFTNRSSSWKVHATASGWLTHARPPAPQTARLPGPNVTYCVRVQAQPFGEPASGITEQVGWQPGASTPPPALCTGQSALRVGATFR